MYEFTFTNSLGENIYIAYNTDFVLESVSGLSSVGTLIQSEKSPYQDGTTYIDTLLNSRLVTFVVQIRKDLDTNRRKAIRVLNPKLKQGVLSFTYNGITRTLDCVVDEPPIMADGFDGRRPNMQRFSFTVEANQPYWEGQEYSYIMAGFTGGLEFPFSFPIGFGNVGTELTITNDGDTTTPLFIELTGPLTDPSLTNETTGEYIMLSQDLPSGYKLEINTAFGEKDVTIIDDLGNRSNGFHYLDPTSTLFGLAVGTNTLVYSAEYQPNNVAVTIWYKHRYIGV